MDVRDNQLFLGGVAASDLAQAFGTPLYVYDEQTVRQASRQMKQAFRAAAPEIHYAMKANPNPALLRILREEGLFIDAVSPMEARLALDNGFKPDEVLYTGNNLSNEEMAQVNAMGLLPNLGSLDELDRYGQAFPGRPVALRVNPDVGAGHHHHVITGGPHSKFGVYHTRMEEARAILERHRLRLEGIHCHIGTGILATQDMLAAMEIVLKAAAPFKGLSFVDFGGGFGIPYRPGQPPLPLEELGAAMARRFAEFQTSQGARLRMKLEPGRFLVAQAGTLLTRVTNLHQTPAHTFIGCDSGFNHLIRPAFYGAYHRVVNASSVNGEEIQAVVTGNICESGDLFTQGKEGIEDRPICRPQPGHLLAVLDAGAYGMSLASQYNLRPRPAEVLVTNGQARLIRKRETYEDLTAAYLVAGG